MAQYKVQEIGDDVYFWGAANDTGGSGADADSGNFNFDVRLAGAAFDAAPTASGTGNLLAHINYPAGLYEVKVDTDGYAAGEYAVFATLLVDAENPSGFLGSFRLVAAGTGPLSAAARTMTTTDADSVLLDATQLTAIAGAIWNALRASYNVEDSFGNVVNDLTTESGGGVYQLAAGALPDVGTAGAGLTAIGDTRLANLDATVSSRHASGAAVASVSGAVGSVSGDVGGNVTGSIGSLATQAKADVQAEAEDALKAYDLDHLIETTAGLEKPTAGTYLDLIMNKDGSQTFARATHSLEASVDNGPTLANQTSILARIGDFAGTGLNTIKGFFQALFRDDAGVTGANAPSEINEAENTVVGAFDGLTDSQEALRDRGDAAWTTATGFSTLTAQDVADALKLAPTVGDPAAGSANKHLDDILEDTAAIDTLTKASGAGDLAALWTRLQAISDADSVILDATQRTAIGAALAAIDLAGGSVDYEAVMATGTTVGAFLAACRAVLVGKMTAPSSTTKRWYDASGSAHYIAQTHASDFTTRETPTQG